MVYPDFKTIYSEYMQVREERRREIVMRGQKGEEMDKDRKKSKKKKEFSISMLEMSLPWWLRQKSICLQCGRPRFDPWVGKILWRRKWQPTPVLLPGKSHGWRSVVGYSPWGHKELDTTELLQFHFAWNVLLVSLIFMKRSLVFAILLLSSISLHWSLRSYL